MLIDGFARGFVGDDFPHGMPTDWAQRHGFAGDQFDPDALEQGIDVLGIMAPEHGRRRVVPVVVGPGRQPRPRTPAMAEALFKTAMTVNVYAVCFPKIRCRPW